MRVAALKVGDLVAVNIRGAHFEAIVTGIEPGRVAIAPTLGAFGYRSARPRQIVRLLARGDRKAAA